MTPAINPMRRICVFCGSNCGANPEYAAAAVRIGRELALRKIGLVYGGGNIGLMGEMADACLHAGGHVIGVIPEALMAREVGHLGLPDLRIVKTMHERKSLMAELADGFIALPGGIGTLEEFFEIITWAQLGLHAKPCGLLNVRGYFDPLLQMYDHAIAEGFIPTKHRALIIVDSDLAALLERMSTHPMSREEKWIDKATI